MSVYPLHELRALLAPPARALMGQVVAVRDGLVEVATPQGLHRARAGATLRVGARVSIRDGVASPAATPGARYVL